eukprot:Lankesteria_metandrocarpae@DN1792_c0_g1_i3.p1
MAHLYAECESGKKYWDKKTCRSPWQWEQLLKQSATVYVGNLAFHTSEDQVFELFSKCGPIKSIVMGLNRKMHIPCGFAFVVFTFKEHADLAVKVLNRTWCDERVIRVDKDGGL